MKKVTIIGLGWLGLPLAEQLQQQGWQVVGTKRTPIDSAVACYPLDLCDLSPENQPLLENLPQALWSAAMVIAVPPSHLSETHYLQGIQALVTHAIQHGLTHLVFISSTSVLPMASGDFDESTPIKPTSTLAKVEHWLQQLPIHCDILRLAGLVGKARHPVFSLAKKPMLSGASQPVNLVHLHDCLAAISLLLASPAGQRVFHLCAPNHPTRQAYYAEIAARLRLGNLQFFDEKPPLVRTIRAEKICQTLGFRYQFPDPFQFELGDFQQEM